MKRTPLRMLLLAALLPASPGLGQVDPVPRDLIQVGYNQPLEGRGPLAAYAFYYMNRPEWIRTNLTLRVAIAPVYLDAELSLRGALGPQTHLAFGIAGGGFADTYSEVRLGHFYREESFTGHGGDATVSLYHLFNPDRLIPLHAIIRTRGHFALYETDDTTAPGFEVPEDRKDFFLRVGLRWGGVEPVMFSDLGMELSAWYEGQFRSESGPYGYGGDRAVESQSHLVWGRALLDYSVDKTRQNFGLSLTMGLNVNPDRFSAYRIGGALPLVTEFPLHLPGYYFQELSAERFSLLAGWHALSLDTARRWRWLVFGAVGNVEDLPGLEYPDPWHSGVGSGLMWESRDRIVRFMLGYAYGIEALRDSGQGAHTIGALLQIDLQAEKRSQHPLLRPLLNPNSWRGFDRLLGR